MILAYLKFIILKKRISMAPTLASPRPGSVSIEDMGPCSSPVRSSSARRFESPVKSYIERFFQGSSSHPNVDFSIRDVVVIDSGFGLSATVEKIDTISQVVLKRNQVVISLHASRTELLQFPVAIAEDVEAVDDFATKLLQVIVFNFFNYFDAAISGSPHQFKIIGTVYDPEGGDLVPEKERSSKPFSIRTSVLTPVVRKCGDLAPLPEPEPLFSPMIAPIEHLEDFKARDLFGVDLSSAASIEAVQKEEAEAERSEAQEEAHSELFDLIRPYFPEAFSIGITMEFAKKEVRVLGT
jgi:hypothetical protein